MAESMVGELLIKASHVILYARTQGNVSSAVADNSTVPKSWFNLDVAEVHSAARELEPWRKRIGLPLVLEIYLQSWGQQGDSVGTTQQGLGETMLERWTLQYTPHPAVRTTGGEARASSSAVYKRMVIALRALYSYVRVLPAYRLHRACKRDRHANFSMRYRIAPAASPDVRSGSLGRLQNFAFAPINTNEGSFSMSVAHQPAVAVRILEQTTAPLPQPPQVIPDYVSRGNSGQGPLTRRSTLSASLHLKGPKQHVELPDGTHPQPLGQPGQQQGNPPDQSSTSPADAGLPLIRRHSWSLQGRVAAAAAAAASARSPHSSRVTAAEATGPATPPSPTFLPRNPTGTPPSLARTGSTPPRYPSSLPKSSAGGQLRSAGSSGLPPTIPRGQRISPAEANLITPPSTWSALRPPPSPLPSAGNEAAAPVQFQAQQQQQQQQQLPERRRQASAPMCIPRRNGSSGMPAVTIADVADIGDAPRPRRHAPSSSAPEAAAAVGMLPGYMQSRRSVAPTPVEVGGVGHRFPRATDTTSGSTPFAMPHPLAQPDVDNGSSQGTGSSAPVTPPTPAAVRASAPFGASYGGSSCSNSFLAAGSPQLPFAITPSSSHSLASLTSDQHQGGPWSGGPSPPMTGRGGGALAAVRRAPSWAARSLSGGFSAAAAALSAASPLVGSSVATKVGRGHSQGGVPGGGVVNTATRGFSRTCGFAAPNLDNSRSGTASASASASSRCQESSTAAPPRDSSISSGIRARGESCDKLPMASSQGSCSSGRGRQAGSSRSGVQPGVQPGMASGSSAERQLDSSDGAGGGGAFDVDLPFAPIANDSMAASTNDYSEQLPFALDEPAAEEGSGVEAREAALAAFVQLLENAPPLRSASSDAHMSGKAAEHRTSAPDDSSGMTLAAGLAQLALLQQWQPPAPAV